MPVSNPNPYNQYIIGLFGAGFPFLNTFVEMALLFTERYLLNL